jgi:lactoylglutathione lyase
VEDVDAEHARFEKAGLAPRKLVDFQHDGRNLARFFFVQDPDGYQIEVIQKQGRYR